MGFGTLISNFGALLKGCSECVPKTFVFGTLNHKWPLIARMLGYPLLGRPPWWTSHGMCSPASAEGGEELVDGGVNRSNRRMRQEVCGEFLPDDLLSELVREDLVGRRDAHVRT